MTKPRNTLIVDVPRTQYLRVVEVFLLLQRMYKELFAQFLSDLFGIPN